MNYSSNVISFFDECVKQNNKRPALIWEHEEMSYYELNKAVNNTAHYLLTNGIKKGDLVGVCLPKSMELVSAVLAILKIGAVYVPIVSDYPEQRKKYIVNHANIKIVLTNSKMDFYGDKALTLLNNEEEYIEVDTVVMHEDDLAYIFYTSGTTGVPKGAMIHHGGLKNRLLWQRKYFDVKKNDRILFKAPIGFDISLWEILLALISGAALIIAEEKGYKNLNYIIDIIAKNKVTICQFVPSMLQIALDYIRDKGNKEFSSLKKVVSSGEELNVKIFNDFSSLLPHIALYNFYGPTEASICVTACKLNNKSVKNYIPLGKAITNMEVVLLDELKKPIVSNGIKGEIYISGIGVGKGYINNEDETARAFVAHYLDDERVMYKTGDIGFYDNNQMIYLGRNDQTIKIRGNRIDLGEIESKIYEINEIKTAVVKCIIKNDTQVLVAFYQPYNILDSLDLVLVEKIKDNLNRKLPRYMLPQIYQKIIKFELTENGKINKDKLLLEGYWPNYGSGNDIANDMKGKLNRIFVKYINADINSDQNFFEAGGSSLEAIKLLMEINRKLGGNILFEEAMEDFSIDGIIRLLENSLADKELRL
ncbi:MAG: non-ribosomal peptide synthetase [Lachnospiraceae bacterium]|nr:non-ribosomal peptide synthetase [Lachnospiraceae bacterium]